MGLTGDATGSKLVNQGWLQEHKNGKKICLAGQPNVGKSTIFNTFTGMHQHTGNWSGKTVGLAYGTMRGEEDILLVDLPGMYSMQPQSEEERIAAEFIRQERLPVLVVAGASTLERSLQLTLEILQENPRVFLCINLLDEASKMGLTIHCNRLEEMLQIPVVGVSSKTGQGMEELRRRIMNWVGEEPLQRTKIQWTAEELVKQTVEGRSKILSEKMDRIITSKYAAMPIFLVFLALIFWLTMKGANIPSQLLAKAFEQIGDLLNDWMVYLGLWEPMRSLLMDGIWNTLAWIVAVMLPPMAIFFPLFTFLEDVGYLPRLAFNLDRCFQCCGSCGKQALPMCMGFGCNAAGVVGCRIIQSPRERLLAILTNSFVPCNGRFPLLAAMAAMLCVGRSGVASLVVLGGILLGIGTTFGVTKLLSITVLKGVPSSFVLELPPYRMPKLSHILVRSLLDRTIFVLGRAVSAAIPAGVLIWLMSHIQIHDVTILSYCTGVLDPVGQWMGLDGTILMGFILGLPANEIVMPIILMGYMGSSVMVEASTQVMSTILLEQGWTWLTMVNVMILCLFHNPCITTLMSIRKETGSWKWTLLSAALPTGIGMFLCILIRCVTRI